MSIFKTVLIVVAWISGLAFVAAIFVESDGDLMNRYSEIQNLFILMSPFAVAVCSLCWAQLIEDSEGEQPSPALHS